MDVYVVNCELRKLSTDDGRDLYNMLKKLPKDEKGFAYIGCNGNPILFSLNGVKLNIRPHVMGWSALAGEDFKADKCYPRVYLFN
jgi:hypothetical protein